MVTFSVHQSPPNPRTPFSFFIFHFFSSDPLATHAVLLTEAPRSPVEKPWVRAKIKFYRQPDLPLRNFPCDLAAAIAKITGSTESNPLSSSTTRRGRFIQPTSLMLGEMPPRRVNPYTLCASDSQPGVRKRCRIHTFFFVWPAKSNKVMI